MKKNLYFVSQFENCKSRYSWGVVDLYKWLLFENQYTKLVKKLRMTTDEKERKVLKTQLPAITVSCICKERNANRVIRHTGLICIDIDGKDNPNYIDNINALKNVIVTLAYVMYCGLSASGNGLFCIIKIADKKKHLEHFYALEKEFYDIGIAIDPSCKDECRLRFYSYDDNPILNSSARVYDKCIAVPVARKSCNTKYKEVIFENKIESDQTLEQNQSTTVEALARQLLDQSAYSIPVVTFKSRSQEVMDLIDLITRKEIDITAKWQDWFTICCVIQNLFGEDGRALFHKVSCFYDGYTIEESDEFFSTILRKGYRKSTNEMLKIASCYKVI